MALIKCTECTKDVSNKAKKCPHCGAKVQKPVGVLGIILALFVGWIFYSAVSTDTPSPSTSPNQVSSSSNEVNSTKAPEATPQKPLSSWGTTVSVDEMTGETQAYAFSKSVPPTKPMEFPYSSVESWLGVGCDGVSEWAYFGFTTAPNLSKDETKSGYNLINTRVKWDETIQNTRLTQDWGSKFIHFSNKAAAIAKIAGSSSLMLELNWHGEGPVNFKFPLDGSSEAIQEMRELCK